MSEFTTYMTPGGGGIAEAPGGLLYHREEVDPAIDALRDRTEELQARAEAAGAKLAKAVGALHEIAGKKVYADDPWGIARTTLAELKKDE